ncbi:MAG: hypothetical protein J0L88_08605 [Xanthomonadales bacterium]|nr:hypothetical protein [Xanthomonadales bacterium]
MPIPRWLRVVRRRGMATLMFFVIAPAHAGGVLAIHRVGADAACDFATLQAAINAASTQADDLTIIRLVTSPNNVAATAFDRNLEIDGRYADCASDTPVDTARRTLSGTGGDSVLRIASSMAGRRSVTLRNLVIRDGGPFGAVGTGIGGGMTITGPVDVEILDSRIGDNASNRGGGIYIAGSQPTLALDRNTIVGADETLGLPGNRAVAGGSEPGRGGGIYCAGASVTIHDARLRTNSADGDGGGIDASDCRLLIEPRPEFTDAGNGFVTFYLNSAGGNGGAMNLRDGSEAFWRSLPTGHFGGRASGNRAIGRGGAVHLADASDLVGDWLRFEDHGADDRGGSFAVEGASNLILRGGAGFRCIDTDCPGIFGTRGITEGESATLIGGAVYAGSGANVDLRQQRLYENYAENGSALHLAGSSTTADLRSVLIARNLLYGVGNGTSTIELTTSAKVQMRYVTMMGNFRASNQFPGLALAASSIRANGSAATVELRNSLVWNDAELVFRGLVGAAISGSCVYAHENGSFGSATVADPLYVDTTGTTPDFSLEAASPALDRCATSGTNEADIFGLARPQDLMRPDFSGPFDAGAIERPSDDRIFADGFELQAF